METQAEVKTGELQKLEDALTRAQEAVDASERELAAARYGLKNSRKMLFDAEDAISAYYDKVDDTQ